MGRSIGDISLLLVPVAIVSYIQMPGEMWTFLHCTCALSRRLAACLRCVYEQQQDTVSDRLSVRYYTVIALYRWWWMSEKIDRFFSDRLASVGVATDAGPVLIP